MQTNYMASSSHESQASFPPTNQETSFPTNQGKAWHGFPTQLVTRANARSCAVERFERNGTDGETDQTERPELTIEFC